MFEYVGIFISYACQLAIILFVLNEFGWVQIRKKEEEQTATGGKSTGAPAQQNNPLAGLMQNMGPMVENMMKNMQQQGGMAPQTAQSEPVLGDGPKKNSMATGIEEMSDADADALLEKELGN